MKSYFYIAAMILLIGFTSCSTAYRTGQTPDDVYFSPTREVDEYVTVQKNDDRYYSSGDDYYEDRFLRMRVQNRYRWSALDDYYFNTPYAFHYTSFYGGWNNPWNSYWTWNNFYNPYYNNFFNPYWGAGFGGPVFVKNTVRYNPPSRPVAFNPMSYVGNVSSGNRNGAINNNRYIGNYNNNSRYNNNNRNNNSFGNSARRVFSGNNNSNYGNNNSHSNQNTYTPSRSYNPTSNSGSSSSGRSSSSSSSGSGSVRPPR